jgi:hypothetical protein
MTKIIKTVSQGAEQPLYFSEGMRTHSESIDLSEYISLTDDGFLYGLNKWAEHCWVAKRYPVDKSNVENPQNIWRMMLAAQAYEAESNPMRTKKELQDGIEENSLEWREVTEAEKSAYKKAASQLLEGVTISTSHGGESVPERIKRKEGEIKIGDKRLKISLIFSLAGIFIPLVSIIIIPVLISACEARLKLYDANKSKKTKNLLLSYSLMSLGILFGLIGIAFPFFSFASAVLIAGSYRQRCKQIFS